jgi:hypothetical protein
VEEGEERRLESEVGLCVVEVEQEPAAEAGDVVRGGGAGDAEGLRERKREEKEETRVSVCERRSSASA